MDSAFNPLARFSSALEGTLALATEVTPVVWWHGFDEKTPEMQAKIEADVEALLKKKDSEDPEKIGLRNF